MCPDGAKCAARVRDHDLNKTYLGLLLDLETITPESGRAPRRCSLCRAEGHNKKTCPQRQREGEDERGAKGGGGEDQNDCFPHRFKRNAALKSTICETNLGLQVRLLCL